jgi:uncharacterized membrane protein
MLLRFFIYGLLGWAAEILWTGLPKRRPIDWTLSGHTQWWTFPLYGQIATLYEPLHNRIRHYPLPVRGLIYALGFIAVEFSAGEMIQKLTGKIPWDYAGKTRWQFRGTTRFDYALLWFSFGLILEPVHDYLVSATPALMHTGRWGEVKRS